MTDGPAENDRLPAAGEGVDVDSDSDAEPVAIEEVLVPVDGSEESIVAVEYAVAIAERYDARVHALYVLDEGLVRDLATGTIEEEEVAARGEEFMDAARECAPESVSLTHSTAYGFSPTQKARHPGSVIIDAAEAAAVDFLVIPREPVGPSQEATLGKAAEYVLQYADQPVLST
jgi:nucleotide-binding universal stress UspA family protein